MKTTNDLKLTETQKKIMIEILLREIRGINEDICKYAFNESVSKSLREHKERVHEIYQLVIASMEDK